MSSERRVLIIDDEPSHLKLYSLILEREGFLTTTALVEHDSIQLPHDHHFDLVLLDYRFKSGISPKNVAQQIRARWPEIRIVVLSDVMWMPDDIAPLADGFVRKGEPQQLVDTVNGMLPKS